MIYQTITIRNDPEPRTVDTMEYPYIQAGVLYIKFIEYDPQTNLPISFITVQPQDVVMRQHAWT
ncbi:MAG: hypothetical protein ACXQTE_05215, partial [Methanosarcinaceae archaeon]